MKLLGRIVRGLDFADWPEIVATGLLVIAVVMVACQDYRSAAWTSGLGALAAVLASYRALR